MAPNGSEVTVEDEGEKRTYQPNDAVQSGISRNTIAILARKQARLADGSMEDDVMHNDEIVTRARDEGCFVAEISVSYWMRKNDDEIAETFDGDDKITALVEDYSDDAWRIVAKQQRGLSGDYWFTWAWTFLPKSQSTVVRVEGVETVDEAWELRDSLHGNDW